MKNRELIQELLVHDLDADIELEVGGDGAVHTSSTIYVDPKDWQPGTITLSSEEPYKGLVE